MKSARFLRKLWLFTMVFVIGMSTISYACGMGAKAPSDGGNPLPPEEEEAK